MEGELRISKGRLFQMVGAATAKLREPKHVRRRSKLESFKCLKNSSETWKQPLAKPSDAVDHVTAQYRVDRMNTMPSDDYHSDHSLYAALRRVLGNKRVSLWVCDRAWESCFGARVVKSSEERQVPQHGPVGSLGYNVPLPRSWNMLWDFWHKTF